MDVCYNYLWIFNITFLINFLIIKYVLNRQGLSILIKLRVYFANFSGKLNQFSIGLSLK